MVEDLVAKCSIAFYSFGIISCVVNLIVVNVKAKLRDRQ